MRVRSRLVSIYKITIVNEHFTSSNEQECADVGAARSYAIGSALAIAAEQVTLEHPFFGAEVTVQDGDGPLARYVISAGVSPLQVAA